jgi:fluoride exporter
VSITLNQMLAVAAGGALGSVLRFGLSAWIQGLAGRGFPWGTLTVNALGCLAVGVLYALFVDRFADQMVWRAGLLIGVLGGFTTFSAFSIETFNLLEQGETVSAVTYVLVSVLMCLAATWLGVVLAKQ